MWQNGSSTGRCRRYVGMIGGKQGRDDPTTVDHRPGASGIWRAAFGMLGAFFLGGCLLPHLRVEWRSGPDAADAVSAAPARAASPLAPVDEPIARAAAVVSPAVVNI